MEISQSSLVIGILRVIRSVSTVKPDWVLAFADGELVISDFEPDLVFPVLISCLMVIMQNVGIKEEC